MIRILHLTDFHLNRKTLRDWNDFYKEAFFEKLIELNLEQEIDLIAFTGDLIDRGGKDFGSASNAFSEFKKNIISPILDLLNLDISRFVICPGNHDIDRFADNKIDENGLKTTLTSSEEVIEFIDRSQKENSYNYIKRIKEYKDFEYELYDGVVDDKIHSQFKLSLKYEIRNQTVGISSINSAWRCFDDDDSGNVLIGENQLNDNYKFVEECDVKIALLHHQLDWLSKVERSTIDSHINKNFDVILSGHVHENMSRMVTGFTGSCFHNVSPSGINQIRTDNTTYVNGFTIIDYNESVNCHYLKYNHLQQKFIDNTDIVDKGKVSFAKLAIDSDNVLGICKEAISNIKEDHYSEMDNSFIKGKDKYFNTTVKSAFIYPPIDDGQNFYEQEKSDISFRQIVNSVDHELFLGGQETGKKSLLYRLIVEFTDEFDIYVKVPVFIDFNDVKNKEFTTIIKEYTRLNSGKVRSLLEKGKFILLIDNINFHESKNLGAQINRLHAFNKDYPKNRIIGSYEHDNIEILPAEIISHCKIPFSYRYIRGLKTREIKLIMKQWLPADDVSNHEESLEKLVNTFSSYNLPNNALSVHLYLWSVESDKKPTNQAVLMEIYIELVLEKLNKENIYRSNFDFTNKVQLISMVAEKIIKKEGNVNYLSYTEFYNTIDEYLKEKVGFTYDVNVIIGYLLDHKIFTKNNQNEVKFSYICFKHFFVAQRMKDNPEFRQYILDETRYFNYPKEIDYYTGLVRSDKETFNLIYERFKHVFDQMNFILESVNPDDYFNVVVEKDKDKEKEPIARNIEIAKIKNSRPSDQLIEKQYDEQLNRISNQKTEIKGNQKIDFDRIMLIMCNTLRNSEGIEDLELKSRAYSDIIKHNITYSILYTQVLIRYLNEHKKLPPFLPSDISIEHILKNMPYHMQHALYAHLGTHKLSSIILNKINDDSAGKSNTKTEIEKFLSIALYSDIQGQGFDIHLRKIVKSAKTIPVQNYLLFKLTEYLHKRSKDDSANEFLYLDLISDLKIRSQKLPKQIKERLMKDLLVRKNQMTKIFKLE
jgi:predicted MPP superfamily phosphohydrolase